MSFLFSVRVTSFAAVTLSVMALGLLMRDFFASVRPVSNTGQDSISSIIESTLIFLPLCILGALPICSAQWIKLARDARKTRMIVVVTKLLGVVLLYFFMFKLFQFVPPRWLEIAAIGMTGVCALAFLITSSKGAYLGTRNIVSDYLIFRRIRIVFVPDRREIAKRFQSLKTYYFREKYVDWLERVSIGHIVELRSPANAWPRGKRPQTYDDPLASRLAQLDARWLNLD